MDALIIGAGPAGLMAADELLSAGHTVTIVDAKPSFARKFLMAGKSGLNLTKMQPMDDFLASYGPDAPKLDPMLRAFGPQEVRAWAEDLGQEMFTGSTGRLFPKVMKASPLLRTWLTRLDAMGLQSHKGWRWVGWSDQGFAFDTPQGQHCLSPRICILATGGASWAKLGSDGLWANIAAQREIPLAPFAPSNAGLVVDWSPHMQAHFGAPLKNIRLSAGTLSTRGEAVISKRGLEVGVLYPLTPALRQGHGLTLDLLPDLSAETITTRLGKPAGKKSLSNHIRRSLKLSPAQWALVMETARPLPKSPAEQAALLKSLPLPYKNLRPMDEAISTAGGIHFDALDQNLMLHDHPGTYCVGEMLDWEAPTGGYLLTACLATGRWAGRAAAARLSQQHT
jgi:uncharacterized flavoprotein (TIGR03862 family)